MPISRLLFRRRGFSLAETLVAVGILSALLMVVGDAIVHTLRIESIDVGRASAARTATLVGSRLNEEARSSTAVFIPSADVLGNPNGPAAAVHEVDFFRRLSTGGDAYVAYRFDAGDGTVTRYEYTRFNGSISLGAQDFVASGISAFDARRFDVTQVSDDLNVKPVRIVYNAPDVVGGNDIVAVTIQTAASGGAPARNYEVHLMSMIAPTSMSVLVPAAPP